MEEREEIIKLYSEGISGYKLEKVYGFKRSKIYSILNSQGIVRDYCKARHPLGYDSDIFKVDNLNNNSAYWLGFLYADG
jgi:hypothetical protein